MTHRALHQRPLRFVLVLALGGIGVFAGPAACNRQAPAQRASSTAANPYPASQPLHAYQQDPAWQHKVAIVTVSTGNTATNEASQSQFDTRQSTVAGDGLAAANQMTTVAATSQPAADLAAQLEQAGFTVSSLQTPPQDGGEYNTIIEVSRYLAQESSQPLKLQYQVVANARVLSPTAQGKYEGNPVVVAAAGAALSNEEQAAYGQQLKDAEQELYGRIATGLAEHLKPTPKSAEPVASEPPPPDPKEVCRANCTAAREPCSRRCCEKELGTDVTKCDAARDGATRCNQECVEKNQSQTDEALRTKKIEECQDGCRRGKHAAYISDPKIAKSASVYAKCDSTCEKDEQACVAVCDSGSTPPGGGTPAPGAPPSTTPAPAAPAPAAPTAAPRPAAPAPTPAPAAPKPAPAPMAPAPMAPAPAAPAPAAPAPAAPPPPR